MTPNFRTCLVIAAALSSAPALAQETPPQLGRYMPLYPALYVDGSYLRDDRDSSYTQDGNDVPSATPQAGGRSALPVDQATAAFTWHFPMFESQDVPFLSTRTHLARVILRHVDTKTEGELARFAADTSDDAATDADNLESDGSGVGDLWLEFGSFVYGSPAPEWRERTDVPLAVLTSIAVRLPYGSYNRDAAANAGSNAPAAQLQLGVHWRPWAGGFVDAGATYREYFQNYEPAFGALEPANQGDDVIFDLSLAHRVMRGLYATAHATHREGEPNLYENPRFAPNAPEPEASTPLTGADNFPAPGVYYDDGTELTSAGLALQYFVTQRLRLGLHYTQPLSGRSGQFLLPFTNREPAGCTIGSTGCTTSAGDTVLVDGMGPARTFSSESLMLSLSFNFGQGDAFTCTGCKQ